MIHGTNSQICAIMFRLPMGILFPRLVSNEALSAHGINVSHERALRCFIIDIAAPPALLRPWSAWPGRAIARTTTASNALVNVLQRGEMILCGRFIAAFITLPRVLCSALGRSPRPALASLASLAQGAPAGRRAARRAVRARPRTGACTPYPAESVHSVQMAVGRVS